MVILYIFASVIIISLISVVAILPVFFKKKISDSFLLNLMSLSVGALLGGVFLHLLPEAASQGYNNGLAINILIGFLVFFVLEKMIHYHHFKKCIKNPDQAGHGHAYHLAPLNLIGDSVHNFLDGLIIAGAYIVSIPLGIAATLSVIFHEIPQEVADFGVLLYSGYSKMKALLFNFLSAATAIVGALIGLILASKIQGFVNFIIPFAAGTFLYIAGSNLVPELHRHCKIKDMFVHLFFIILGIGIMVGIGYLLP